MKIIIVGCGKVGYTIAKNLSMEEGTQVVIIDQKSASFDKVLESIDVMTIKGNAISSNVLAEAGVNEADLIICATNADETNILCCITARHLGAKHTIARVRDPEYALELFKMRKDLGLDMIINPELEAAREISRLLRFPTADGIDTFVGGRVELVSFRISEVAEFFVGKSVAQIFYKLKFHILLAIVERGDTALIPNGSLVFEQGDIVSVMGKPSYIMDFFKLIGKSAQGIRDIMIVGGGRITYYLVTLLEQHNSNMKTKIIEIDRAKCEDLSESLPGSTIIHGDGTDEDILISENLGQTGAIICLTDRDEENVIIALYSMHTKVKKVIVKINHINHSMIKNLGLGSVVCPKDITSDQIIRYVRGLNDVTGSNIKAMFTIFDSEEDKIEALEFNITRMTKCLNIPLKDILIKKGVLVGCIVRATNIIIPSGTDMIKDGDTVIVISKNEDIQEFNDILLPEQSYAWALPVERENK